MGRLLAIDYGQRRCGLAVTDPMRIVATALETVATSSLCDYILAYLAREQVDEIIIGQPRTLDGRPSDSMRYITPGINRLRKLLPAGIKLTFYDERFTSALAHRAMIDSGMTRSQRRDKGVADRMSATIILNEYLQSKAFKQ